MPREICISDIHGCDDEFKRLLRLIGQIKEDDMLILLGDYFDRGPDSYGVYQRLKRLKKRYGRRVVLLYGNHDDLFCDYCGLDALRHYDDDIFLQNRGGATLRSFQWGEVEPREVATWIRRSTSTMFETERAVYVHAGLYVGAATSDYQMIWMRDLTEAGHQPKLLIASHTPVPIRQCSQAPYHNSGCNYVIIDNGCAYGLGPLLAYDAVNNVAYYSDGRKRENALKLYQSG